MAGGVGPIRSSGTLMGIIQVENGCITELHRRGDIMYNLVCHIYGMPLYFTGNGRVCSLSQRMLWLVE